MKQVIEKNNKNEFYVPFLKELGARMREYRKGQKMTQAQMAQRLGMAFISYNSIERGVIGTTLKTLFKIATILCVSPAQLLLGTDEILLKKSDMAKNYIKEGG